MVILNERLKLSFNFLQVKTSEFNIYIHLINIKPFYSKFINEYD